MNIAITIVVLALVQVSAGSKDLLDRDAANEARLSELCRDHDLRIARPSTIRKLIQHIEAGDDSCGPHWLQPLRDMQQILDASAEDVCSSDTIDKMEQFHWRYVVGTLSRSWRKAAKAPIPEPLKMFFMHFAKSTTDKCKSSLANRLEEVVIKMGNLPTEPLQDTSKGFVIDTISVVMVPEQRVKKFSDFFMIFHSIMAFEKKKGHEIKEEIPDPKTGEVTYISVKLSDASKPHELQEKCKQLLRPVYSETVLPVMRLIDLGYGNKVEDPVNSDLIAHWYGMAQLCQLIIPVKFYTSSQLKKDQLSIVSEEEAQLLDNQEALPASPKFKPQPIHFDGDYLTGAEDDDVAELVKANSKARGKMNRRTVKNVLIAVRSELKSRAKSIFVSKKTKNNQFVLEKDETLIKQTESMTDTMLEEDELVDNEQNTGLLRQKRSFFTKLFGTLLIILIVVVVLGALACIAMLIAHAILTG